MSSKTPPKSKGKKHQFLLDIENLLPLDNNHQINQRFKDFVTSMNNRAKNKDDPYISTLLHMDSTSSEHNLKVYIELNETYQGLNRQCFIQQDKAGFKLMME